MPRLYRVQTAAVKTSASSGTAVDVVGLITGSNRTVFITRVEVAVFDALNATDGQLQYDAFYVSALSAGTTLTPVPKDYQGSGPAANSTWSYSPTSVTTTQEAPITGVFNQRDKGLWIARDWSDLIAIPAGGGTGGSMTFRITENTIAAQQTVRFQIEFFE